MMGLKYEAFVSNYTSGSWVRDPEYLIDNEYKCSCKTVAANAKLEHSGIHQHIGCGSIRSPTLFAKKSRLIV